MKAEIISIGDELLIGQTVNTNASWMGQELSKIGVDVYQATVISDDKEHIISALKEAKNRVGLVIITGGLGPTRDDITKTTLAEYFNKELVENKEVLSIIKKRLKARRLEISTLNRKQALVPEGVKIFLNHWGTAPGMWFEEDGRVFVSLPGVPTEMKGLMKESVISEVIQKFNPPVIIHRTILTMGTIEAHLAKLLEKFEDTLPTEIKLAYLPSAPIIKLRLSARGKDRQELEQLLNTQESKLLELIPDLIFGRDSDSLEQIVGDLLRKQGKTISTAESCTGGSISRLLTAVPGSSDYYTGSIIAYSYEAKMKSLGVDAQVLERHGAVSKEIVIQMALGVQKKMETDFAIAVSGIAGPGGGLPNKPVGTVWIGVVSPNGAHAYKFSLGNDRTRNIHMATLISLNLLRKSILKSV